MLLEAFPRLLVVGIDRDLEAIEASRHRLERFGGRIRLVHANFADLERIPEISDEAIRGVLYDLGVSSPQLDRAERGFQYRGDSRLDMRMDRSQPLRAEQIVNTYSENELASVIGEYGEERFARRIARAIVRHRARSPFRTAGELAEVVREAIPAATRRRGPHPARRTFQALRIATNRELEALSASIPAAVRLLLPGGRIGVIAYHSLEDRITKRVLGDAARGCRCPSDLPVCVCGRGALLRVLTRKPVRPSIDEVRANRRADSARLRVAERLGEAA